MDSEIELRGHHLLCQFGFRGEGYSKAFVDNMTAVLAHLRQHSSTLVRITEAPDILCRHFPSDQPNHCGESGVTSRDRLVLRQLELDPGSVLPWSALVTRAATQFVPEDLLSLCATCPWLPLGYCQQGLTHAAAGQPPNRRA